jgi:hypothetical protein
MLRSWSALSLLLASACLILLAHRNASGSDATQEVDLCALALAPQDYAGRLVKIHGVVSFGFEESAFTPSNCYARL